jgi:enolase-phosphatase E1
VIASGNICAVVLDIEGTISSIEFVKHHLFPYARRHISQYVREHESALSGILDQVRSTEGNADLDTGQLIEVLLRWMDEDRKLAPLKTLQGMIWQQGFDSGELRAHFYDDAVRAMREWHQRGVPIYIYSSGSIAAQKLLFSHTSYGDLSTLLSGYFDTTTGSKLETRSYQAIAARIGHPAAAIVGNLLMAYLAQPGHERQRGEREQHGSYILEQLQSVWETFRHSFAELWRQHHREPGGGCVYQPRLCVDAPDLLPLAIESRLAAIWHQSLGFAGSKMIRRIAGLAHVADFETIADPDVRAACERNALDLARELLLRRDGYATVHDVVAAARQFR